MADLPQPQSYEQILSDMLSAYATKVGINDFNVGGVALSFYEVMALAVARSSGDIFQILRDFSIDRATGDALKRLALENNVTPITAKPTTGPVNILDTSFKKISTKVYSGANPPNIGSTQIKVSDASTFPSTGSIYIGRGTPNVEGPLAYTSIAPSGGFFIVTLSVPTTKFHNLGEAVILAQGGVRTIGAGTVVIAPSVGASPDIQYSTISTAVILDGETEVDNVQVSALIPGIASNVPIGAITQFSSPPFSGATVKNVAAFTTGTDNETDDQLRARVKNALASTGLGTATAVKAAVIGASPSDEQESVVSDSLSVDSTGTATLYIDNGNLYEAKSSGVGLESIVDSALGGEQFFQLATGGRQAPIAKAFLITTLSAPFDLVGGDTLSVVVGGVTYSHTFDTTDFLSPGGATAFEVTASINGDTALGFEATTSGNGSNVVIRSKAESNDTIETTVPTVTQGRDASIQLGFPSNEIQTLRLYKNNQPLSKDGSTASIFTQSQQLWSSNILTGDTLILSIDGTSPITFTIVDADFLSTGLYTSVASSNSLAAWVQVFNAKLTGVTATIVGQQIELTSNLGINARAQLVVDPASTLVTKGMFNVITGLSAQGVASDFTLDRNTAQFELAVPLVKGDKLSAGSAATEARITSEQISGGSVTLTAEGYVWFLIDDPGTIITTSLAANTLFSVALPGSNIVRYGSTVPNAFANVHVGDYIIVWSPDVSATDRLEGRVHAMTSTSIDLLVTTAEAAAVVPTNGVNFTAGFVVLRSTLAPQKFSIPTGTNTLDQIAAALNAQTESLVFSVIQEQFLVVASTTMNTGGSVMVVTSDGQGSLLNLTSGATDSSKQSLIAFYDSQEVEADMPLFFHSTFGADSSANPPDTFVTSATSSASLSGRDPNDLIAILHPYGQIKDAQAFGEHVQETTLVGSVIGLAPEHDIRRLRNAVDRFYLANPLDFGSDDTAVAILDADTTNKSFSIPFFRKALTNTGVASNSNTFNAYDVDSGATTNFVDNFGSSFTFANFKVLMRAKKTLKPAAPQTALLYRSTLWGRSGEKIRVGYVYPSVANAPIGSTISVEDQIVININLKSGIPVASAIDPTTEWNVTVTPNTPSVGIDQVTYTFASGTTPTLALSGGEYVNISTQTEFSKANTGIFRVSTQAGFTPTSTSFSVQMPTGTGVAETNRATQVLGGIAFYLPSTTTAAQINTYVNANLNLYLTTTIVNDGGTTGSGTIALSTYEDSAFAFRNVALLDGINWISTSNLAGSPNFTFKRPLALPTDVGYAFNNGEEIRLIPTTFDQVKSLISVLAVSGFTTVGTVNLINRASQIELATDTLGSKGAIQLIGGLANEYEVPILDSASRLDNVLMSASTDAIASRGVHSDQWFRLQATNAQAKEMLLSSNTSVTISSNTPTTGQATISLANRLLTQRYFGKPRHHVRPIGTTFRVEKQGNLVCISWNGVGSSPAFLKSALNFNSSGGGTLNVSLVSGTNEAQYLILSGNANFTELSIGDLVTVAGLPQSGNNGTFLVTGVSDNGKTIQVLNPNAANEYSSGTFTFTGNSTAGDTFTIGASNLIAGTNFAIGATSQDTAANLAAVIGTLSGVIGSANGNVVTVMATAPSASTTLSYSGSAVVTVSNSTVVGDAYTGSTFTASSQVSEGDSVILTSPFTVLNQGLFRVIRRFNDSIYIENQNVVEEEVTLPSNLINLGFDSTTSFMVNATNGTMFVNWNGVGTEPHLENAQLGDLVTFGTDFSSANQGTFMVVRSGVKLPQVTQLTMPTGAQFTPSSPGQYFKINSAGNVNQYYVWFNVNGTNADPAPGGLTGLMVAVLNGDTSSQVATKTAAVITVATGLTATSLNNVVIVTTTGSQATTAASNISVPAPFTIATTQSGQRTFLECINPSVVNQSPVFVTGTLVNNRPQIKFVEYEATAPGDIFTITGTGLGATNAGGYAIVRVLNRDTAIVSGNVAAITNVSLNGQESAVFMAEGIPYTGYKRVLLVASQPGAPARNLLVFDTNAQYEKIDESAGVQMISLNKLDFNTTVRIGLDSYRYNTGLIAEANRIIYGDPRDPTTYPGVGAAGANIFVREPLARRVQVSIDVRLTTGAPFTSTVQQVRTNVSYLIKSNPVGESIAISGIIAVVNLIPGVRAVAISSPLYDATNDLIFIAPSEKAIIIDPTLDISVNQIGS